jgi:hypothetical protein
MSALGQNGSPDVPAPASTVPLKADAEVAAPNFRYGQWSLMGCFRAFASRAIVVFYDGGFQMASSADPRSIAAHLAAALISSSSLENAKGGSAAAAAKIYFDVLDAVMNEQKRRYTPSVGRADGRP